MNESKRKPTKPSTSLKKTKSGSVGRQHHRNTQKQNSKQLSLEISSSSSDTKDSEYDIASSCSSPEPNSTGKRRTKTSTKPRARRKNDSSFDDYSDSNVDEDETPSSSTNNIDADADDEDEDKEDDEEGAKNSIAETVTGSPKESPVKLFRLPSIFLFVSSLRWLILTAGKGLLAKYNALESHAHRRGEGKDDKPRPPYKWRDMWKILELTSYKEVRPLKACIGRSFAQKNWFEFHFPFSEYTPASRTSLIFTFQLRYVNKKGCEWAKSERKVYTTTDTH